MFYIVRVVYVSDTNIPGRGRPALTVDEKMRRLHERQLARLQQRQEHQLQHLLLQQQRKLQHLQQQQQQQTVTNPLRGKYIYQVIMLSITFNVWIFIFRLYEITK